MLTLTPGLPSAPVNPRGPDAPYGVNNSNNNDEGGICRLQFGFRENRKNKT